VRLLHIIRSVDPRGGGPIEAARASAAVWRALGHRCDIVCLDAPDEPWVVAFGEPVFALGPAGSRRRAFRRDLPWRRYGYTPELARWLAAHGGGYDAIIVNGLWNFASYGSWRALAKLGKPYFLFPHGMLDPWFNEAYPAKALVKALFWRLFENRVVRDARGVLFTCEEERRRAARSFRPYAGRDFVVGLGARDVEGDPAAQRAAFAAQAPATQGRKLVLFLGRLHPKKGVDLLIAGFARHAATFPAFDLVVAGPDQAGIAGDLQQIATRSGIADRVHWTGMLTGDAKWGALREAAFFVLPSHQENFGIAVAEALAFATPVLVTDKVNIWREIAADGAGLVVEDTSAGVADGLARLCALSDAEREVMSRAARATFLARFDLGRTAIDLLALLADPRGARSDR
jgi:glycosyltransferase involved in cell wall biosynthesis